MCKCGNTKDIRKDSVMSGNTSSCGCKRKRPHNYSHGMSDTVEYTTWRSIKTRCHKESYSRYSEWGGRGIKVCDRWLNSFENFYADMGPRPSNKHSIDRINNDGNYEPSNCKWSSIEDQGNNKSNNILITYRDKTLSLTQWCRELDFKYLKAYGRVKRGVTDPNLIFKSGRL